MIEGSTSGRAAIARRITGVCGIISQLVGITTLLGAAISNSSWFSWTEDHISAFGVVLVVRPIPLGYSSK